MDRIYISVLLKLSLLFYHADSPSNVANEFYIGFMKNSLGNGSLSIFVSTMESNPVNFSVRSSQGNLCSNTAHNNYFTQVTLPNSYAVSDITERDKGVWIRATDTSKRLIVYGVNVQQDGFVAFPCYNYPIESYTYYAVSTPFSNTTSERLSSEVLLVGCEDNTAVTITPTQEIQIPSDLVTGQNTAITLSPGQSYTVSLNRLQTFQFDNLLDLTGSKVASNKPIAFFSGHECADVPVGVPACDHLAEQIPPTITWGRFFLCASYKNRVSGERYRVIATGNTTVTGHCNPAVEGLHSHSFIINLRGTGSFHEFQIGPDVFCSMQANRPVLLMQFASGAQHETPHYGNPFMMVIPPVEQHRSNYTLVTQSGFDNFLTITVTTEFFNTSDIILNGASLAGSAWTPIYCSAVDVCAYGTRLSARVGTSFIYHSNPAAKLGVVVYGFSYSGSYGYPAGMQLQQISGMC